MPMPDVGLAPPPSIDVASQMKPTTPAGSPTPGGGLDIGALLGGLMGNPMAAPVDITPKVMEVEPLLTQLARQVPALGPDVDRLAVELKSRMSGLPSALAGLAGAGAPIGPQGGAPGGMTPLQPGAPPVGAQPAMGAQPAVPPALPPNPMQDVGAMDLAMQLEIKLPAIGKDDPTLMPYVQGFVARMREEVPKVVQGMTEAVQPPPQVAPTDSMLNKIPVTF